MHVLYHLLEKGKHKQVCQVHIADFMHLDKGTVTRSIKKLEKNGLITRKRSAEDSREYNISLTPKADKLAQNLKKIRQKWTRILSKGFKAEEKEQAVSFLERMAENAHAFLKHEHKREK